MSGEFYYPEIIGSGVALFDFDNDGQLDILVLAGQPLAPRCRRAERHRALHASIATMLR